MLPELLPLNFLSKEQLRVGDGNLDQSTYRCWWDAACTCWWDATGHSIFIQLTTNKRNPLKVNSKQSSNLDQKFSIFQSWVTHQRYVFFFFIRELLNGVRSVWRKVWSRRRSDRWTDNRAWRNFPWHRSPVTEIGRELWTSPSIVPGRWWTRTANWGDSKIDGRNVDTNRAVTQWTHQLVVPWRLYIFSSSPIVFWSPTSSKASSTCTSGIGKISENYHDKTQYQYRRFEKHVAKQANSACL